MRTISTGLAGPAFLPITALTAAAATRDASAGTMSDYVYRERDRLRSMLADEWWGEWLAMWRHLGLRYKAERSVGIQQHY